MGGVGKSGWLRRAWNCLRRTEGTQLVELAVTLPLLVVMVVGIFDFGGAYNLKQKLSMTAREGARFAASSATGDLANPGTPDSVLAIRDLVDRDLVAAKVNDCGLGTRPGVTAANTLKWTFTTTGGSGCPGVLTLTVERSYDFLATVTGGGTIHVISTRVTISYPYSWQFGNVIGLLAPGANYAKGVSQITGLSIIPNMD
jgi:Flp pilus assembly protein TadG